jgi:hypothetical protein
MGTLSNSPALALEDATLLQSADRLKDAVVFITGAHFLS